MQFLPTPPVFGALLGVNPSAFHRDPLRHETIVIVGHVTQTVSRSGVIRRFLASDGQFGR